MTLLLLLCCPSFFIKLVLQVTSIVFTSNVLRKSIKMKDGSPEEAEAAAKGNE